MKKISFAVIVLLLMLCVFTFTACGEGSGDSGDSRPELTLTTNIEGAGTVAGGGHVDYNEDLFINAEVNNGYHFLGWYYDNDLLSTSAEYNCKMWDKDVTLEAKFIALPDDYDEAFGDMSPEELINRNFKLSVVAGMPKYGKISVNDGDNKVQYSSSEKSGTSIKARALTTSSQRFLGWFDEADNLVMTNAVLHFSTPSFDYTLTAKWECNCEYTYDVLLKDGICELCESRISKINLTNIIIPEGVTEISASEFAGCYKLTTITLPNSITKIGEKAFHECTGLKSITIPDSVTSIGDSAFQYCKSLTSLTIPDGITSIGDSVFSGCTSLTSATIPDSVTSIGSYAFHNCSNLTNVTIPDSVTSIGNNAFASCNQLIVEEGGVYYVDKWVVGCALFDVTIANLRVDTKGIADSVFTGCGSLTSVTIPDGITSIGDSAFRDCENLTSVTIGNGVTSIGDSAFRYCENLTFVTIPDSVKIIGGWAFYDCKSLTSVTIGNGVKTIGERAFEDCKSLTSVIMGNGVTSIGDYAFYNCTKITSIKYRGTSSKWRSISKGEKWDVYPVYKGSLYSLHTINYTITYSYTGE